ncbi:MAG: hypothetical protein PHP59_04040 [Methanofollis sp.]|uniref:hypothetical protein n=1 Tax=Methanofollis sp. TaxID=2052835 RepID=UPI0026242E30|nr:hypothetical protein [Methanofollis sp.]MDD4254528.1 hypothetical protein [Methanofollis sp.]
MNGKILYSIVLVLVLAGALAYAMSYAREDVIVDTFESGGRVVFHDNDSHGTFHLGVASADFEKNAVFSSSFSSIETGTGTSTFTAVWKSIRENTFGGAKTAVFTLTVWDPAGVLHSTTHESRGVSSGTLSISFSPHGPGEGRFLLTSTISESRLNFSTPLFT